MIFLPHNSISFIISANKSLCKQKENESKQIKCKAELRTEGKLMPSILSIDSRGSHLEAQHLEGCCRKVVSSSKIQSYNIKRWRCGTHVSRVQGHSKTPNRTKSQALPHVIKTTKMPDRVAWATVPALRRERQTDLWVLRQCGLLSEFQDSSAIQWDPISKQKGTC